LLLLQVLLVARLSFVEKLAGFDRLTVWHRLNGKITLVVILAHVVAITIGYALTDRVSLATEINLLLNLYPGMITATVGTGLIILVALTSLVIVKRRLRYEAWFAVHFMAYAGIALAWFHQIPTGNEFLTNATAADYWTSLYLATLALLVAFRVLQSALRTWWHDLRVAAVERETASVVSVRMSGRHLKQLGARPGQFFIWRFLNGSRWWEAHPFSLSAVPADGALRITVKNSGDFSSRIDSLAPGTRVVAEGPLGLFTEDVRHCESALLIAGGIGITPIRALTETIRGDAIVVYRAMSEADLVFREELDAIAADRGIQIHYVVGDHNSPEGANLLSREHLQHLVPDISRRDVYICGPPAMADRIVKTVERLRVPRRQIHIERFAL
jgi:predicted ferric reductase